MNYFFHVRPWFLHFFLVLEKKILARDPGASIHFLTMNKSCFKTLHSLNKKTFYLPDEFSKYKIVEEDIFIKIDQEIHDRFGFGLNYIYDTERFTPIDESKLFIYAQAKWYYDNITSESVIIAMSCDHFCYILSGVINEVKSGQNLFVQPIGFPVMGNVILSNPWNLVQVRNDSLSNDVIDSYIHSLIQSPEKSIHYMKIGDKRGIKDAIATRVDLYRNFPAQKSIFSYLEIEPNLNVIPDRLKKKQLPSFLKLLSIDKLREMEIKGVKIFYYPLQLEPEMSILAYSPFYKSQMEVIRLIVQSLKSSDVLVIKENPKMIGDRNESFYNELRKFPNVLVIDPAANSREIIKLSYKTISVTGTACIEAVFLGKNSLLFGYAPLRKFLIDPVVSDVALSRFAELLYSTHSKDEILNHAMSVWKEFSKYVIFGDFIAREIKTNKYQIRDEESLTDMLLSLVYEKSV